MRPNAAVIVSLIFVLVIGAAALAINTRILDASSHGDVGRANEILVPAGTKPAPMSATNAPSALPAAPPSRVSPPGDRDHDGLHHSSDGGPDTTTKAEHEPDE